MSSAPESAMKRLILIAAVAAGALSLAACETATPYQPLNARGSQASGGYSERQIEANRFMVRFAGNSLTSRDTVERFLLYRSAQLTLQNGYDWFTTVERHTDRDTSVYASPGLGYGPGYGRYGGWGGYWGPSWGLYGRRGGWRYGYGDPFFGSSFDYHEITQYDANAEIVMGKGPKPEGDPRAFDARAVQQHIGPAMPMPI